MDSREFWMFIGALTLLISGLQITLSTSYPVFNKLFGPEGLFTIYDKDKVLSDPIDHYNAIQVPFAMVIVLLIGAGQFLSYRKTSTALFFKRQILTQPLLLKCKRMELSGILCTFCSYGRLTMRL